MSREPRFWVVRHNLTPDGDIFSYLLAVARGKPLPEARRQIARQARFTRAARKPRVVSPGRQWMIEERGWTYFYELREVLP